MQVGQKVKFRKKSGLSVPATFLRKEDRGAGKGQGVWIVVKGEDGRELIGRESQVTQ